MFPESPLLFQAFPFPEFGLRAGNSSQGWGLDELRAACMSQIWRGGQELLGQVGFSGVGLGSPCWDLSGPQGVSGKQWGASGDANRYLTCTLRTQARSVSL